MSKEGDQPKKDQMQEWSDKNKQEFDAVPKQEAKSEYAYGPLNKNQETRQLESIIKDVINQYDKGQPINRMSLGEDGNVYYQKVTPPNKYNPFSKEKVSEQVNLTEIIEKANLSQMSIPKESLDQYWGAQGLNKNGPATSQSFIENTMNEAIEKGKGTLKDQHIKESYFEEVKDPKEIAKMLKKSEGLGDNKLKDGVLKDGDKVYKLKMENAELHALKKYSDDERYINAVARGNNDQFQRKNGSLDTAQYMQNLVYLSVGSQALNKLPDLDLPVVKRRFRSDELAAKLQKDVKENNVTQEHGIVSTSYKNLAQFGTHEITLQNVRGKYIAPISSSAGEEEYALSDSTQLKWTGHKVEQVEKTDSKTGEKYTVEKHSFTAEGANVLLDQKHAVTKDEPAQGNTKANIENPKETTKEADRGNIKQNAKEASKSDIKPDSPNKDLKKSTSQGKKFGKMKFGKSSKSTKLRRSSNTVPKKVLPKGLQNTQPDSKEQSIKEAKSIGHGLKKFVHSNKSLSKDKVVKPKPIKKEASKGQSR